MKNDTAPKTLSKEQMRYAQMRLNQLFEDRRKALLASHTTKNEPVTAEQLLKGIKNGSIKLKPLEGKTNYPLSRSASVTQVFDVVINDVCVVNYKAYRPAEEALRAEITTMQDQIMLGDAQQVLDMLNKFAAGGK
jgi:hypothetical protein